MSNIKRNILIYLDSYPMLTSLPPEQRGWVLTALMVYGDRLSRDSQTELDGVLDQFPQLTPEARVVCRFMAGSILRDTQKWLNRQQYKSASPAPARNARRAEPPDPAQQDRRAREDMDRIRQMMERLNGAD